MSPDPSRQTLNPSSQKFFEARYQGHADPWSFATSPYEQFRYERIVAALAGEVYGDAMEPACSIGVLTAMLAPLCGRLFATDIAPSAVEQAQERCRNLGNVTIACQSLETLEPRGWDLIVFSEVGYYFSPNRWQELAGRLIEALPHGATVLGCHWLGHSQDHCIHGEAVHSILAQNPALLRTRTERHTGFLLERWSRR